MVGLIPLFAVETLEPELLERLPDFKRRLEWFIENRPDLTDNVACMRTPGQGERRLLSVVSRRPSAARAGATCSTRTSSSRRIGIRALSRVHREHPYVLPVDGHEHRVDYEPGESTHGPVRRQLELARPGLVPGRTTC